MAQTVMIFGPNVLHGAFEEGVVQVAHVVHSAFGAKFLPGVIEIEQHDDAPVSGVSLPRG